MKPRPAIADPPVRPYVRPAFGRSAVNKDVRESLIAIVAVAAGFALLWLGLRLQTFFHTPSWAPFALFLFACAVFFVALWRRARRRRD